MRRLETGRGTWGAQHGCTVNPFSAHTVSFTSFLGSTWSSDRTSLAAGTESRSHAVSTVYVPLPAPAQLPQGR